MVGITAFVGMRNAKRNVREERKKFKAKKIKIETTPFLYRVKKRRECGIMRPTNWVRNRLLKTSTKGGYHKIQKHS